MTEPTTQALIEQLKIAAIEIKQAGHYGWGNTCTTAADAIEAQALALDVQAGSIEAVQAANQRLAAERDALSTARTQQAPKGLFIDLIAAQGPEFVAEMAAIKIEPAPSTAGEQEALAEFALECSRKPNSIGDKLLFTRIAALLQSTALPVGDLTDERIESVYNLAANQHLRPQDKAIVYKFARALLAAARPQPVREPLTNDFLQTNDYYLLHRFIETTEDDESYDITKAEIKRLADLGVVQSHGFGKYSVTMFGYWVHERYWEQNPSLPLKTNTDRDAEAAHGITQGGKV